MSQESAPFLHFKLGRSRYLALFILAVHSLALVASITNALPWELRILLCTAVLINLYFSAKQYGVFGTIPIVEVRYADKEGWTLQTGDKKLHSVTLLPTSVLTSLVSILHFKADIKVIPLVVFSDSMGKEEYRRLRVFMKTARKTEV